VNIKQLKTLLAVVEMRSFAAAGDKIGLSHSSVSLQIKAVEDAPGVLLFDRIKRPPVLRPGGVHLRIMHARLLFCLMPRPPSQRRTGPFKHHHRGGFHSASKLFARQPEAVATSVSRAAD
jgi:regulatory helix-turn-helix LysR family protein